MPFILVEHAVHLRQGVHAILDHLTIHAEKALVIIVRHPDEVVQPVGRLRSRVPVHL